MRMFVALLALFGSLVACRHSEKEGKSDALPEPTGLEGEVLAKVQCGACHEFVPPEMLPLQAWKADVLPAMGHRLGIYNGPNVPDSVLGSPDNAELIRKSGVYPSSPRIANDDWEKIKTYYLSHAPESIPDPKKDEPIRIGLEHFRYVEAPIAHRPPLTAMVKILRPGKGLVFSDGKNKANVLTFLKPDLSLDRNLVLGKTPVQYWEQDEKAYLTLIGPNVFPSDQRLGRFIEIQESGEGQPRSQTLLDDLKRPVYTSHGDLDNDGLEDLLVCEFGDLTGQLALYRNLGNGKYTTNVLLDRPGAIRTILKDYDSDGDLDVFALMAQGDEGVFYLENKGQGKFDENRLLTFSPLNGSQYLELADFNSDGVDDLLYVCGDNADKTPYLKKYHGVYVFLNDGNLNFEQAYFYPLNGAYKALARDFDLDGDLDIAAISFFPDYRAYPEESFVYLENQGDLSFTASSFAHASDGRWMVMDAGDLDGDGDLDLALGSFVQFLALGDTTGLSKRWLTQSPSVVILENTIRKSLVK